MKITDLTTMILEMPGPANHPYAPHVLRRGGFLVVEVHTDEGITGTTFLRLTDLVHTAMSEIGPIIIGEDPFYPRRIRAKLQQELAYYGLSGITTFAISAVDFAVWDIMGKAFGQPVHKLLGAHHERIPAFATIAALDKPTPKELARRAERALAEGFHAVKWYLEIGSTLAQDLERLKAVRDTVGPTACITIDGMHSLTMVEAMVRGRAFQDHGVFCFEDPIAPTDTEGLAQLAHALDMAIAVGEQVHNTKQKFRELIDRRAADIFILDYQKTGGVLECMEVSGMAAAWNIPVNTHGGGLINAQLLAAMSNALYIEESPLNDYSMFVDPPVIRDGFVEVPQRPGLGIAFRPDFIEKHRVA
jgi:L-alanine-DL-glutamate epimerase-like enolase superfamily enzyme